MQNHALPYAEMPSKLYAQAQFKGSYPELVIKNMHYGMIGMDPT